MGIKKTTKLSPYSRGNKDKIELQRIALARNAEVAKTQRVIEQRRKERVMNAIKSGRGYKEPFDYVAFKRRPLYIEQVGAPGFNHF